MKHHIIFVPGLADKSIRKLGQEWLITRWRRYDLGTSYYHVGWANTQTSFNDKLQGLLDLIDNLAARGNIVSLMAPSAGATLALHAFAKRKGVLHKLVVICGALGPVTDISPSILQINPAFKRASKQLPSVLTTLKARDRQRILSVIPLTDNMVRLKYMHITGAKHITQHTHGHLWSIIASLLLPRFTKPIVDFIQD